jgi:chain length determinant protein (polysaccharide antigen chain regulator)
MQSNSLAHERSDEIDLLEILKTLWQEKLIIVATTVVLLVVAAGYAFLSRPVYEAKYYISPPTVNDIANLNYGRTEKSGLKSYSVDDVYKIFLRNLQSESQLRTFFEKVYLPSLGDNAGQVPTAVLYNRLSKAVTVASVDKDELGRWVVSVQDPSAKNTQVWVGRYVELAADAAKQELIRNVTKEASIVERNLSLQIDMLRESGKRMREDSISQLREALAVAKASGLQNSVVFTGGENSVLAGNMADSFSYLRGSKALEAELKNLESRDSNDPFIPGLRKLQSEYDFYKWLRGGVYDIAVYRQDGTVDEPLEPVKPKKLLVLALGLGAGVIFGSIIALLRSFIRNNRKELGLPGTRRL